MSLEEILSALSSEDAEERRRAASALTASASPKAALPLLERALGDFDWRVRKEAVKSAVVLAERVGIDGVLVRSLAQGENVGQRNAAIEVGKRLGPRVVEPLLVALREVEPTARKFVIAAMETGGPKAIPALRDAIRGEDANTALVALETLARVGGPAAEEVLREHLGAEDAVLRLAALEGLHAMRAEVDLEILEPLVRSSLTRRLAVRVAEASEAADVVPVLMEALSAQGARAAGDAAIALVKLRARGGEVGAAVCEAFTTSSTAKPSAAKPSTGVLRTLRSLAALGKHDQRQAAAWLLIIARDVSSLQEAVGLVAADALPAGAFDDLRAWGEEVVGPLLDLRERMTDPRIRATALVIAAALGGDFDERLHAALRGALGDRDPRAARAAVTGIRRFVSEEDAPALVAIAERGSETLAELAAETLLLLSRRAPAATAAALAELDATTPCGAAYLRALVLAAGADALPRIRAALSADEPAVRRRALQALVGLEGELVLGLVTAALADEDADVQVAAVDLLGTLRDEDGQPLGVEALLLCLKDPSSLIRARAANALSRVGDAEVLPALRAMLRTQPPARPQPAGVVMAVLGALRAVPDPRIGDQLKQALTHSDPEVVKVALRTAVELELPRRRPWLLSALRHPGWDVRIVAGQLIGRELERERAPRLKEALREAMAREHDPLVRRSLRQVIKALP